MTAATPRVLWAPQAWLPGGGWAEGVRLEVGAEGCWHAVEAGHATPPAGSEVLGGPALPGLVDAHSHAFQRAFAGLAERAAPGAEGPASPHAGTAPAGRAGANAHGGEGPGPAEDDFWSWRERMYAVAQRVTPASLRAIAAQLYVELLQGGYTQVCEFHYLQHDRDGRPYADDPLALSWALADAAAEAGIGLTLLPVLYERAGFGQAALSAAQRRFGLDAAATWQAMRRLREAGRPLLQAGFAVHSLRAAHPASIRRLLELADAHGEAGPIHIHVAEQTGEVDDCLAATGRRPIEWLVREIGLDARWQLVHATHASPDEIEAVAASGAGLVLCPSTEANLGDGLPDLPAWLGAQTGSVPIAIGSDSQVTRDWREELRGLEYGQRLLRRRRNVARAPLAAGGPSGPAEMLFARALQGGSGAAGLGPRWGLQPGARADLLVADPADPLLLGLPLARWLDALVFTSPARPWREVRVAGRPVVREGRHGQAEAIAQRYAEACREWAGPGES